MAEPKFILKEPNTISETLIYLFYNFNYQRLKYSTGEKVNPKFWNPVKQRVKETKAFPEHLELNARLDKIYAAANTGFRRLRNDNLAITPNSLKKEIESLLNLSKPAEKLTFLSFIRTYIEEVKAIRSRATISVYETTLSHLETFSSIKKVAVDFEDITLNFYNLFTQYLSHEKGYLNNTTGKYIRVLKVFLNEATERNFNTKLDFRSKKFKASKEETEQIYLDEGELNQLYKLDLSNNSRLEKVRDLFLIGCYTGLRFSDFSTITENNIDINQKTLKITTKKTRQNVMIPLKNVVISILQKYGNNIPAAISNQKMNLYLKELGEKADLKSVVQITKSAGKIMKSEKFAKHDLLTTHTARRSFATNAYLAGVPTISIMKLTGHKTEKSFMQYIRISQEENALLMLEHPHFK